MHVSPPRGASRLSPVVMLLWATAMGAAPAASAAGWSIVPSPNALANQDNIFNQVACTSPSNCWAVGYFFSGTAYQTLIAHWDGSAWAIVASPNAAPDRNNYLFGVACASAGNCWAGGYHWTGSAYQALILSWDGTSWGRVPTVDTSATQSDLLTGMACASETLCWAVGNSIVGVNAGGVGQTLILRWDSGSWSAVPSPNAVPARGSRLTAVSCVSTSDCWAVGNSGDADGTSRGLFEHWDGSQWNIAASPDLGVEASALSSVHCVSPADCWAAGYRASGVNPTQTLVVRWDGLSWQAVPSPNHNATTPHTLFDVACPSASECWVAGYHKPANTLQTLIERWDGSAWQIVASPNTSAGQTNALFTVACPAPSGCVAAGDFANSQGKFRTLAIHQINQAPLAQLTATPAEGVAPLAVELDASSSSDPDGDALVGYSFDFGDGTDPVTQEGAVVVHEYSGAGSYAASVTVADARGGVSSAAVRVVEVAPPQVEPFAFLDRTGVATAAFITSQTRTVAGFAGALPVSVDKGQYSVDGGAWTRAAGQMASGSTLRVRHVSASTPDTATETEVTVGSYTTMFRSVTSSVDRTPEPIGFETQTAVEPGAVVESNVIIPGGYNAAIAVMPGPGVEYSIAGAPFTGGSGTIEPGQTLQLRHTASGSALGYTRSYVKVGGVIGYFTTRTRS